MELLTTKQVAERLGLGVSTIHMHIRKGHIKKYKEGRFTKVDLHEFREWRKNAKRIPIHKV